MAIELTQGPECDSCKWWGDHDNGVAVCRRYPPTLVVVKGEMRTSFPETWHNEFCGEWTGKPPAVDSRNLLRLLVENNVSVRLRRAVMRLANEKHQYLFDDRNAKLTVKDFISHSWNDVDALSNCGAVTRREMKEFMEKNNLVFLS